MRVVTLLAIGSLALAPSLAWADDTLLKAAGRFGDPVIVALLIFAESSPPRSGGRAHNRSRIRKFAITTKASGQREQPS